MNRTIITLWEDRDEDDKPVDRFFLNALRPAGATPAVQLPKHCFDGRQV